MEKLYYNDFKKILLRSFLGVLLGYHEKTIPGHGTLPSAGVKRMCAGEAGLAGQGRHARAGNAGSFHPSLPPSFHPRTS